MSEATASRFQGSQAAYEPWYQSRYVIYVDVGELPRLLLPAQSTAFTESGVWWATKLAKSISAEELQAVGSLINIQPEARLVSGYPETEERRNVEKVIRLLDEWMADDSGYDEETWPELKAALDQNRFSSRKLFND